MDFSWTPHFGMFWILPLLCFVFMALMMIGCGGMLFRSGHGGRSGNGHETAREILERRYASGEIGKEQYDATRHDLNVSGVTRVLQPHAVSEDSRQAPERDDLR
jgi:putative membrane protein